ncbi:MAG: O-antigen ligase family protein [Actinomycetota bacterium]|nr:O-antigen ligase family protein [Actinomycetota bacterium]
MIATIVLPLAILVTVATTQFNWLYGFLIIVAPLLLYLSLKKPFLFPLGLYTFSIPFENLLIMSGAKHGATLTRLLGAAAILALPLKGVFENKIKAPDKLSIWWVLFSVYCILSAFWGISGEMPSVRIMTILGLTSLYLAVSAYNVSQEEYETVKWFIFAGGLLSSIMTIIAYHQGLMQFGEAERVSLMSLDDNNGIGGVNKQAFDMLLPLAICIGMLWKKNKMVLKGLFLISSFIMFFGIVVTGSRGGLFAGLVIMGFFIFYARNRLKSVIVTIILLLTAFSMTPQFFVNRINNSIASHASGRFDIWHVGLKSLEKYWLFGAGLDCFPYAYTKFVNYTPVYMGLDRAPHNIFIGMFVELGIIGGGLMIAALIMNYLSIGSKKWSNSMDHITLKAAFAAIITGSLSQDVVWYKSFWLLWMIIIMYRHISEEKPLPTKKMQPRVQL